MKVYTRFPLLHKMAHPVECHVDHPPLCARYLEKYCARPHVRCCFSNWVVLRLPGKRHQQSGGEQPQEKTNFPSSDHLETKLSVFDCFVSTQILVRAWHWLGKKEVQQRNTLASKMLSLGKVWKYANKWIFEKKMSTQKATQRFWIEAEEGTLSDDSEAGRRFDLRRSQTRQRSKHATIAQSASLDYCSNQNRTAALSDAGGRVLGASCCSWPGFASVAFVRGGRSNPCAVKPAQQRRIVLGFAQDSALGEL